MNKRSTQKTLTNSRDGKSSCSCKQHLTRQNVPLALKKSREDRYKRGKPIFYLPRKHTESKPVDQKDNIQQVKSSEKSKLIIDLPFFNSTKVAASNKDVPNSKNKKTLAEDNETTHDSITESTKIKVIIPANKTTPKPSSRSRGRKRFPILKQVNETSTPTELPRKRSTIRQRIQLSRRKTKSKDDNNSKQTTEKNKETSETLTASTKSKETKSDDLDKKAPIQSYGSLNTTELMEMLTYESKRSEEEEDIESPTQNKDKSSNGKTDDDKLGLNTKKLPVLEKNKFKSKSDKDSKKKEDSSDNEIKKKKKKSRGKTKKSKSKRKKNKDAEDKKDSPSKSSKTTENKYDYGGIHDPHHDEFYSYYYNDFGPEYNYYYDYEVKTPNFNEYFSERSDSIVAANSKSSDKDPKGKSIKKYELNIYKNHEKNKDGDQENDPEIKSVSFHTSRSSWSTSRERKRSSIVNEIPHYETLVFSKKTTDPTLVFS